VLLLQAVVLGIVQGITEFLPISSDGHLVLVPSLLGWERFGLGFDVILHAGTLLATILYFRRDLLALVRGAFSRVPERARERRLAWLLVASAVPSVGVVLILEPFVDGVELQPVSDQIVIAAWGLLATTLVLGASELIAARQHARGVCDDHSEELSWTKTLVIGFAQGFAALPGLSRSGTTISTGQALGMSRGEAARFSFLMSVPIISAAIAKTSLDLMQGQGTLPPWDVTIVGLAVTTLVGFGAIAFLLPFVRRHSLWWFAAYTGIAGILLLVRYAL
jgi:undecaprenyl-diphosphatase